MARIFVFPLLVALTACEVVEDPSAADEAREEAGGNAVTCAQGQGKYAQDCWYERTDEGGQRLLVIHHPDGTFRRLEIVDDGRGLIAADGAEAALVAPLGEMVEVTLADYRYLLPATIKSADANE